MDFSNNFRLILIKDNTKTTFIVRPKTSSSEARDRVPRRIESMDNLLRHLNLPVEKVPFKELVPGYKQIKENDLLLGQKCLICHDEFKLKQYKRTLSCGETHAYHKKCIDRWLKTNFNCPLCRKDIGINYDTN